MAVHPDNPRSAEHNPKRPNTRPHDRGRITAIEAAMAEMESRMQEVEEHCGITVDTGVNIGT